jgi:hypothetical protein
MGSLSAGRHSRHLLGREVDSRKCLQRVLVEGICVYESQRFTADADHPDESVQGPPVPRRGDPAGGAVVSTVSSRVSACVGDSDGTRPLLRRELHLAVGTGVCARVGQALPSASEEHEQELPRGRDL